MLEGRTLRGATADNVCGQLNVLLGPLYTGVVCCKHDISSDFSRKLCSPDIFFLCLCINTMSSSSILATFLRFSLFGCLISVLFISDFKILA